MILWIVLGWVVIICLVPIVILTGGFAGASGQKGLKVTRGILYGFMAWMAALVIATITSRGV